MEGTEEAEREDASHCGDRLHHADHVARARELHLDRVQESTVYIALRRQEYTGSNRSIVVL